MERKESIWFFTEEVNYVHPQKEATRAWIRSIIRNEGYRTGQINIIFCSDDYLHEINVKYLKHNTLTDIITFDLSESREEISGDIYISLHRAKDNARKFNVRIRHEIRRLIVHGVLHLTGYRDKAVKEKELMTRKEDYYLSLTAE